MACKPLTSQKDEEVCTSLYSCVAILMSSKERKGSKHVPLTPHCKL